MQFTDLCLPPDCQQAVWMHHSVEDKDWIIAQDHRAIYTLWANKKRVQGKRLKDHLDTGFWQQKVAEKIGKGYQAYASYQPGSNWISKQTGDPIATGHPVELEPKKDHSIGPCRAVREVQLYEPQGLPTSKGTILRLWENNRLDHAEFLRNSVTGADSYLMDTPLYQTVFENREAAEKVIEEMIALRINKGWSKPFDEAFLPMLPILVYEKVEPLVNWF